MKTLVAALAAFAVAGGIAYAAIPDPDGTYHACMLKGIGTIRIIDPAKQQRCTSLESEITFNQRGPAGASPTVAQLGTGDAHCASGGAAITDANGTTAYVCNGAAGRDGQPFSGTFTSPNGAYRLSVTDSGVDISGNGMSASFSGGGVAVQSPATLDVRVGSDATVRVGSNMDLTVGGGLAGTVGSGLSLESGGTTSLTSNRNLTIDADQAVTARAGTDMQFLPGHDFGVTAGNDLLLDTGDDFTLHGAGDGLVQAGQTLFLRGATIQEN